MDLGQDRKQSSWMHTFELKNDYTITWECLLRNLKTFITVTKENVGPFNVNSVFSNTPISQTCYQFIDFEISPQDFQHLLKWAGTRTPCELRCNDLKEGLHPELSEGVMVQIVGELSHSIDEERGKYIINVLQFLMKTGPKTVFF